MTRLAAIVVMPPDEQHPAPWLHLVELPSSSTYAAKRSPEARAKAAPVVIPTLAELHVRWPIRVAPPKRPRGFAGGGLWWALKASPTAADRRRANRRARQKARRSAYLNTLNAGRSVAEFMVAT